MFIYISVKPIACKYMVLQYFIFHSLFCPISYRRGMCGCMFDIETIGQHCKRSNNVQGSKQTWMLVRAK